MAAVKVTGIAYEIDDATQKYATKRANHLNHYLPRHARKSATTEVKLAQVDHDHGNKYEVEIIINVHGKIINTNDSLILGVNILV